MMSLLIAADPEGKMPLHDLGEVLLGEEKEIPFWVVNNGDYRVINLKVETTYPDTDIHGSVPLRLQPKDAVPLTLIWRPGKDTLSLAKKKIKRTGEIKVKALEVIE